MRLLLLAMLLHDTSVTSSRVEVGRGGIVVTFTMSREDFAAIGPRPFEYLASRLRLSNGGEECTAELVRVGPAERGTVEAVLRYGAARPIGELRVRCEVLNDLVKDHRHVMDFSDGRTFVFDRSRVEADWSGRPSMIAFVLLGVEHILTGWDHLVFLLALLVVATSLRQVAGLVTAFTVAHSVTLGLTALRLIGPPAALVEIAIAASIVWVAVENIWAARRGSTRPTPSASLNANGSTRPTPSASLTMNSRWLAVFAFGLVHGMGFGGVLLEMHLAHPAAALLGFNGGVELGQLLVVALVYPLLALARRREAVYRGVVVRGLSGAAACAGLVWFVDRLL